jgi:hypothetical protein
VEGRVRLRLRIATFVAVVVLAACSAKPSRAATSVGERSTATPTASTEVPSSTSPVTSTTTNVTPSTVPGLPPEQPTGAVEITPTAADLTAIGSAYASFVFFDACPVEPVDGKLEAAEISATGVKWAFGPMQPAAGCTIMSDGKPQSPYLAYPFGDTVASKAVFTEQPGGTWKVNWFESDPFPCPADLNHPWLSPGPGSPAVPLAVLNAVGVRWSSSPKCNTALELIPLPPQGAP